MEMQDILEWAATGLSLLGAVLVALPSVDQRRRVPDDRRRSAACSRLARAAREKEESNENRNT